jgi:mycothiol synthase
METNNRMNLQQNNMNQPTILTIEPYRPSQHLPAVSRLLTLIEEYDHNGDDPSEAFLLDMLGWPNFEPGEDCWVVADSEEPDSLIGYGSTYAQTAGRYYGYVAVHPDWRRRGLGGRLLAKVIERTRQRGAGQLSIDANSGNMAANGFLSHHHFRPVGHSWVMRRPAGLATAAAEWPAGFTIVRYPKFDDPQLLADALNAFVDMWGHGQNERPSTAESVAEGFFQYYDPEGIFVVFAPDGRAVGYVSVKFEGKEDEEGRPLDILDGPGVVSEFRPLILQRPMVLAALEFLQVGSGNGVELQSWGDGPETAAVYNELGFETKGHFISYLNSL